MSSRKEQKAKLREERLERERAAQAAERRRQVMGYAVGGGLAAAAVIAIVVVILVGGGGDGASAGGPAPTNAGWPGGSVPDQKITDLNAAAQAAGCKANNFKAEGRNHTEGTVTYRTNPPTSGDHNPNPADDGSYLQAPQIERLVHELEHGRIIIWFTPRVPNDVKGKLKALFDEDPAHMVLTPNETGMPYQVAASAWTHSLTCPKYNDRVPDALRAFKGAYRDRGPEFVP